MDTREESAKPERPSLRVQLSELNSRSRWYTSQLWQVPFAYLAITAVALGGVVGKGPKIFGVALIAAAGVGCLIVIHWFAMLNGARRAIDNIREVEQELRLQKTAEYKPWYVFPLLGVVIFAIILYLIGGIYSLCLLSTCN
jgi:hypothetical protein